MQVILNFNPENIKFGLLLDENIPKKVCEILEKIGLDVKSMSIEGPGAEDQEVFELAAKETRVIVTFDKDFGKLVFGKKTRDVPGVILLRFHARSSEEVEIRLESLLTRYGDKLKGSFTVVEENRVRIRPL